MLHQTDNYLPSTFVFHGVDTDTLCPEVSVRILTAESEYQTHCIDNLFNNQIQTPVIRECVKSCKDGIIEVIIDAKKITDSVIQRALQMVIQSLPQLDGKYGVVYFGPSLHFNTAWITKN